MARILIIDDDAMIRGLLREWLESAGHEVIDAEDGNVGVKLYKQNPSDLVITDIVMPDKEGIETIREIRRDFPDAKIIAVSGGGSLMSGSACLDLAEGLGVQRALAKPIDLPELLLTIREVLQP